MPRRTVLLAVWFVFTMPLLAGSGGRQGTNGAHELLIPVGTRDIAMGGSTAAITAGVDALFWNPAGSARISSRAALTASHMNYIADIGVDCGALSAAFEGFGVISLQVKALNIGEIPVTTVETPDGTGETFEPQFVTVGLSYARAVTDRISIGATVTAISETMGRADATGLAFSAGIIYENMLDLPGLSLGIVVRNIGPKMRFDGSGLNTRALSEDLTRGSQFYRIEPAAFELPTNVDVGVGYRLRFVDDHTVQFAASFQGNTHAENAYRFGGEYGFQSTVFLRGGYDYRQSTVSGPDMLFGPTMGLGLALNAGATRLSFDYAYRATRFFGASHVVSVTLEL